MDLIFEYEDKKLKLPVNPSNLKVHIPSSAQKVNVIGIGQVSVPQEDDLATISIQSFFWKYLFDNDLLRLASGVSKVGERVSGIASAVDSTFGTNFNDDSKNFKVLSDYIKWIQEWKASKKPARFTAVTLPNEPPTYFDFEVTCDDFNWEEKAGEEGDYYYEMQLLEYRHYEAKLLNTSTDPKTGETTSEPPEKSRANTFKTKVKEITTKATDCVWGIAKKYGNGEYDAWKKLYEIGSNRNIIANNLQNLGNQTLQVPKEWM